MGPSVLFKLCGFVIKMRLSLSLKRMVSSRLHSQEPLGHLVEEQQDRGSRPDLTGTQAMGSPLHNSASSRSPHSDLTGLLGMPGRHLPLSLVHAVPLARNTLPAENFRPTRSPSSSLCSNVFFSIRSSLIQLHTHTHTLMPSHHPLYLTCCVYLTSMLVPSDRNFADSVCSYISSAYNRCSGDSCLGGWLGGYADGWKRFKAE